MSDVTYKPELPPCPIPQQSTPSPVRDKVEEAALIDKLVGTVKAVCTGITYENGGAMRREFKTLVTDFAAHIRQQERERAAKIAMEHVQGSEELAKLADKHGDTEGRRMHNTYTYAARAIASAIREG